MWLGVFAQILFLIVVDRTEQLDNFSFVDPWRLAVFVVTGGLGFFIGRLWWRLVYVEGRWAGQRNISSHD